MEQGGEGACLYNMTNNKFPSSKNNLQYLYITVSFRSLDDPPGIATFIGREKCASPIANLTNVVSEMWLEKLHPSNLGRHLHREYIPQQFQLRHHQVHHAASTGISTGKIANIQSNYLQQMRELHTLFECGALTQPEF